MKSENIDIIFLLDRSGSMHGSEKDTIGGFNSFIESQIKSEVNAKVTAILFDHGYDVLYRRKDLHEVEELTENKYYVRGSTALLDAIGRTILTMSRKIDNNVLFVITTDGYENSSREFTKDQIRNLINDVNWEFIYLGADIDSYREASKIGIERKNVSNFKKSSDGIDNMYKSLDKATMIFYNEGHLDASWKEGLE